MTDTASDTEQTRTALASDPPKVTVLGLGTMGQGVTHSLVREGFDVTVWNRSRQKADALAEDGESDGVHVADTAAEAVSGSDVILSVLFDADSVLSVLGDVAASVPADAVWVQTSTIGLDGTARVAALADRHGVSFVEAMMLGTKQPAEAGKLVMLTAGDPGRLERIQPVLDAIGTKTVNAGGRVGNASALKLAANAWVASVTAATAQSLAIARGLGVDPQLFLDAIAGGATDTPYAHVKGAAMLANEYPPSFALDGLRKDVGLIGEATLAAGVNTTLIEALAEVFATASDKGFGADDIAAVYEAFGPPSA